MSENLEKHFLLLILSLTFHAGTAFDDLIKRNIQVKVSSNELLLFHEKLNVYLLFRATQAPKSFSNQALELLSIPELWLEPKIDLSSQLSATRIKKA